MSRTSLRLLSASRPQLIYAAIIKLERLQSLGGQELASSVDALRQAFNAKRVLRC